MSLDLSFSELRELAGVSVEEAADQLGYSVSTVYRWERGEIAPKAPVYRTLETLGRFNESVVPMRDNASIPFRFIDLFAGIGGLRLVPVNRWPLRLHI